MTRTTTNRRSNAMIKKQSLPRRSKVPQPVIEPPKPFAPIPIPSSRFALLIRTHQQLTHEREVAEDVHRFPLTAKTLPAAQQESEEILFAYTISLREYYSMSGIDMKRYLSEDGPPPFEFEIVERM